MTNDEISVVQALVVAWNAFVRLPSEHPDDAHEFRSGIHMLQDKILARPARRALNAALRAEDATETNLISSAATIKTDVLNK